MEPVFTVPGGRAFPVSLIVDEVDKKFEFDFAGSGQHNPLTFSIVTPLFNVEKSPVLRHSVVPNSIAMLASPKHGVWHRAWF
jgi:hypothetical protein